MWLGSGIAMAVTLKKKKKKNGVPRRGTAEMNPTRNDEVAGSILGLAQWVKDLELL